MNAGRSALLFLGSGGTAGSGITKEGNPPPADGGFFESPLVRRRLGEGAYPALSIVRRAEKPFTQGGLYVTWNDLFIYRSLVESGALQPAAEKAQFEQLHEHAWPNAYGWRDKHYKIQFCFCILDTGKPWAYYLAELAIWDLRVLVKDIYCDLAGGVYAKFWQGIHRHLRGVVNLNYDTSFDDTLAGAVHVPCDSPATSEAGKPECIRPHGSLKWTSTSSYSVRSGFDGRWENCCTDTLLQEMGYRDRAGLPGSFPLKQPLIVTPADAKEEVIGNSSMPGLRNRILRYHWQRLTGLLGACSTWVFVGTSLSSGDEHFRFLLRRLYGPEKKIHCSCYAGDHTCRRLRRILGRHIQICAHDIERGRRLDAFLEKPDCELLR